MNIKLITFTGEHAPGGVPRWVRDFKKGFPEAISYSWSDCPISKFNDPMAEWDRAQTLNSYLIKFGKIKKDDIIIVDGYWGKGLEDFPNVISVCHGIWSHLIKEEADAGLKPDFPLNHIMQVGYRKSLLKRGGRLVAVSEFIQHQMEIQWGFKSHVINNGIDLEEFAPYESGLHLWEKKPLIIHGINDKGNPVKGWNHIEFLRKNVDADIMSLDEAWSKVNHMIYIFGLEQSITKYQVLSMADFVVIPSAFEGNSYFALETLACNIPVVAYDIGLFYEISKRKEGHTSNAGCLLHRRLRSPEETLAGVKAMLRKSYLSNAYYWDYATPRKVAQDYSVQKFHNNWKKYLKEEFNYGK